MFVRAVVSVVADAGEVESPLVIPSSAPLITGKRAVVYVEVPGKKGTYQGREIVLGPRVGGYYLVREGLSEGELVVVNGNFKIDSAIQILAKPSMMSPKESGLAAEEQEESTQKIE
jgi:Cu(I)/Ag(I) efflux system membrane fusion protein